MKGQLPHVAHEVKILPVCEKEWELRIPEGEFGETRGEHRSKQLISNTPRSPHSLSLHHRGSNVLLFHEAR